MKNTLTKLAVACALTLSATAGAMANSVTQPGETAGLSPGAALPPGFYFIDTTDWGTRDTPTGKVAVGVTIPVLVWSTPWKIFGARLSFLAATPAVEIGVVNTGFGSGYVEDMYNPFFGGKLTWDLGGGWGFGYTLGAYVGVKNSVGFDSTPLIQAFALSYTGNNWNLTANAIWGVHSSALTTTINPDFLNLDLTATKKFGKWEVGAVGFYSTDLNNPCPTGCGVGYLEKSQFAVGGLIGYNFGPVITQTYLTRDVYEKGYGGYDTRIWSRVIIPLGDPLATSSNLMYHK
jgi:hypothetical protein